MTRTQTLAACLAATTAVVLACAPATGAGGATQTAGPSGADLVVSTEWLAEHLEDPGVVVLATGGTREGFDEGHIPGAGFVSHDATLGGDHGMEESDALARILGDAGARDDARIVIYSQTDNAMELGWFYMAFASTGHGDHVSMLSGNLTAWRGEGRPVSTEAPERGRARLTPKPVDDIVVDAVWVRERLEDATVRVLDVRTERERGQGYVPGSTLVLWQDLYADLETLRFKSRDEVQALLVEAGLTPGQQVVTYCAVGMRASLMYFAAKHAGVPARAYLGSWNDWQQQPGFPIGRGGGS